MFDRWKRKEHPEGTDNFRENTSPPKDKSYDHYYEGLKLYNDSKYDEALAEFDEAIQNDRRHEYAYYYKADTLYKQGKLDEALKPVDDAIKLNEIHLKEWGTKKENDKTEEVKEQLAKAYQLKGSILLKLGRTSEAADCFNMVSKYYPNLAIENPMFDQKYMQGLVGAILSYLQMGAYRKDQALVDKEANVEEYKKTYHQARERLDEYIKIKPFDIDALFLKGEVILDSFEQDEIKKEELDEVKLALNKAIEFDPSHAPAHTILGSIYQRTGFHGLALDSFVKAIAMYEDRLAKVDKNRRMHDLDTTKIPSWKDWDYVMLRIYLALTIMGKSMALASTGKEREAMENLEEADKIHFDNFQRTAPDDVNYVSVRFFYADNFLRKGLVDIMIARINFTNRLNENVMTKLEHAEKHIDMSIKFIEQLQKEWSSGKIRFISARQIVNIKTAEVNFKYLKEIIRVNKISFQTGQSPSFIQ